MPEVGRIGPNLANLGADSTPDFSCHPPMHEYATACRIPRICGARALFRTTVAEPQEARPRNGPGLVCAKLRARGYASRESFMGRHCFAGKSRRGKRPYRRALAVALGAIALTPCAPLCTWRMFSVECMLFLSRCLSALLAILICVFSLAHMVVPFRMRCVACYGSTQHAPPIRLQSVPDPLSFFLRCFGQVERARHPKQVAAL